MGSRNNFVSGWGRFIACFPWEFGLGWQNQKGEDRDREREREGPSVS